MRSWKSNGKEEANTRLLKHKNSTFFLDKEKCFNQCYFDSECKAASYLMNEENKCYFYDQLNFDQDYQPGWISFEKRNLDEKVHENMKFDQPFYVVLAETRQKCFDKCKSNEKCMGASIFSKPKNCFFYKSDSIKSQKSDWVSYIKN